MITYEDLARNIITGILSKMRMLNISHKYIADKGFKDEITIHRQLSLKHPMNMTLETLAFYCNHLGGTIEYVTPEMKQALENSDINDLRLVNIKNGELIDSLKMKLDEKDIELAEKQARIIALESALLHGQAEMKENQKSIMDMIKSVDDYIKNGGNSNE